MTTTGWAGGCVFYVNGEGQIEAWNAGGVSSFNNYEFGHCPPNCNLSVWLDGRLSAWFWYNSGKTRGEWDRWPAIQKKTRKNGVFCLTKPKTPSILIKCFDEKLETFPRIYTTISQGQKHPERGFRIDCSTQNVEPRLPCACCFSNMDAKIVAFWRQIPPNYPNNFVRMQLDTANEKWYNNPYSGRIVLVSERIGQPWNTVTAAPPLLRMES